MRSTLANRNVFIHGKRTSMRFHQETWDSLQEISRRENITVGTLCEKIKAHVTEDVGLTAMIRVYVMCYFRDAATEEGHKLKKHGRPGTVDRLLECL